MILDIDLWTVMAIVGGVIVLYLLTMRIFFRKSQEAVKKIDYSKVREWKDDKD